jgi:NAD(P)-dependent dehydrogenase (short-subunit alcohol dehydrogenase family)
MLQPPHYNFVEAGMINFTGQIATYYSRKGVRANCSSPGGYFNHQPEPFLKNYCKRVPAGRLMDHTASDASEYITGINLFVDGGWTAL